MILDKLEFAPIKPKTEIETLMDLLLYCIASSKSIKDTVELLEEEYNKPLMHHETLEKLVSNLELLKLANMPIVRNTYIELMPYYMIHKSSGSTVTKASISVSEIKTAMNMNELTKNTAFRGSLSRTIKHINSVIQNTIVVYNQSESSDTIDFTFLTCSTWSEFREYLCKLGYSSIEQLDKYETLYRSKFNEASKL